MTDQRRFLSIIALYAGIGAIFGVCILHPLILSILWLEFAASASEPVAYVDFMQSRLWLIFVPKHLHMAIVFAAIGAVIGIGFGVFTHSYLRHRKVLRFFEAERSRSIPELIAGGETDRVEFKSSIRWDVKEKKINRALEKVIGKTLAGFFNGAGGDLIVGVADDGCILGLEADYKTLRHKNRDGFERSLTEIVKTMLGGDLCARIHVSFARIEERDVCRVTVQPSDRAVYLDDGGKAVFYLRTGNSTRQLDIRDAMRYAQTRWA